MSRISRLNRLNLWIGLAALVVAAVLIWRALRRYSFDDIAASVGAISLEHLALGAGFAAASYLCLTGSDWLAVRYTRGEIAYPKVALASFVSLSIGHTLGFAALSSGAVRLRFYTAWGLSPGDVGRILLFCGATVLLGMMTLGGIAALIRPDLIGKTFAVGTGPVTGAGVVLLAAVALYLGLAGFVRRPLRIRRFEIPLPPLRLALGQLAIGPSDQLLVAAVLHQMLSASGDIGFFPVAAIYVVANGAAIATHVPGGLGVIEAVVLSLVPGANVIGALIAFRVVYFLIPFLIGGPLFCAFELARRRRRLRARPATAG